MKVKKIIIIIKPKEDYTEKNGKREQGDSMEMKRESVV